MSAALCYTADDLAEKLILCKSTVYAMAEREEIPSVKIGSGPKARVRFPKNKIDPWLRQMGMIQ